MNHKIIGQQFLISQAIKSKHCFFSVDGELPKEIQNEQRTRNIYQQIFMV